jgi:hypothetical protein
VAEPPDLDAILREHRARGGGSRQTTRRILAGRLTPGGDAYRREHLASDDPLDGPHVTDVVLTNTCSFGHVLDDKVRPAGVCEIGGEIVCSADAGGQVCMQICACCGAVCCRRHSRTYGSRTYCLRCRWVGLWRTFWRLD